MYTPEFEFDMSLIDQECIFIKEFYYEIQYKDQKYNILDLIAVGGNYKLQVPNDNVEKENIDKKQNLKHPYSDSEKKVILRET